MSDLSVFDNKVEENGLSYYVFPPNYPLFKAHKRLNKGSTITFRPNRHYFFGLKNMDEEYINDYETEYGVIFEFKTTRTYRLLALDDKETQITLYNEAPANIKIILENNYGYKSGKRDSLSEPDRILTEYLCSINQEGYAIHNMSTYSGGIFHDELAICDASGIDYVTQVTPEYRAKSIIESGKLQELSNQMKESRKKTKTQFLQSPSSSPPSFRGNNRLFDDDDEFSLNKPNALKSNLFMDDDDDTALLGGKKYKKKTNRKSKKKRPNRKTKRGSRKYKGSRKNTKRSNRSR